MQLVVMRYKFIDVSEKSVASVFTYPEDRLCTLCIRLQSVISQKTLFIYLFIYLFISLYEFDYSVFPFLSFTYR